ncbi:MAG TPA: hypothetical protein VM056_02585 [Terriglobales bacterium]|nr:hypothetical protein [Terriglobales bacterium]
MAKKQVVVKSNVGSVEAGQEVIILSRETGDSVHWVSEAGKPAVIVFASADGSPFRSRLFKLKAKGSVSSGPITRKSRRRNEVKVYKYTIMGAGGNNDPIIIVKD